MFSTDKQEMHFSNLNTRSEKHGPEDKPAADITLSCSFPNKVLNSFQDGLMERLYDKPPEDEKNLEMDVTHADFFPALACKKIKPFKWDEKWPGYRFRVMNDREEKKETCFVLLADATLKDFTIELQDNGVVKLTFKVSGQFTGKDVAYFYEHPNSNLIVSLEPPSPEKIAELAQQEKEAA